MNFKILEKKALSLRKKTFMAFIEKGEAHLGGSFSMIETLVTLFESLSILKFISYRRKSS